jgi:hypothetical protein
MHYMDTHTGKTAKTIYIKPAPSYLKLPDSVRKSFAENDTLTKNSRARSSAKRVCYLPAARRLLLLTLPLVPTPDSPPVSTALLGPEARRMIAFAALAGQAIDSLSQAGGYTPSLALLNPDSMRLTLVGSHTDSSESVVVNLGYVDDKGALHRAGGISKSRPTSRVDAN